MSGMSKTAARKRAAEGGISIGELRAMIAGARGSGGTSRVNPLFTKEQCLDIMEKALGNRDDHEVPRAWVDDPYRPGRKRVAGDQLIVRNILREAGP